MLTEWKHKNKNKVCGNRSGDLTQPSKKPRTQQQTSSQTPTCQCAYCGKLHSGECHKLNGLCFECGEKGHRVYKCPRRLLQQQKNPCNNSDEDRPARQGSEMQTKQKHKNKNKVCSNRSGDLNQPSKKPRTEQQTSSRQCAHCGKLHSGECHKLNGLCFECGERGHRVYKCPKRLLQQQKNSCNNSDDDRPARQGHFFIVTQPDMQDADVENKGSEMQTERKHKNKKNIRGNSSGEHNLPSKKLRTQQQTSSQTRVPQCTYCGKLHSGECHKLNGLCFKCGEKGHRVNKCPKKQLQQQRKNSCNNDDNDLPTRQGWLSTLTQPDMQDADVESKDVNVGLMKGYKEKPSGGSFKQEKSGDDAESNTQTEEPSELGEHPSEDTSEEPSIESFCQSPCSSENNDMKHQSRYVQPDSLRKESPNTQTEEPSELGEHPSEDTSEEPSIESFCQSPCSSDNNDMKHQSRYVQPDSLRKESSLDISSGLKGSLQVQSQKQREPSMQSGSDFGPATANPLNKIAASDGDSSQPQEKNSSEKRRQSRWEPQLGGDMGAVEVDGTCKRRKTRWASDDSQSKILDHIQLPDFVKNLVSGADLDPEIHDLKFQLLQINTKLQGAKVFDDRLEEERSPSPPPVYNNLGIRINSREVRLREKLIEERKNIISRLIQKDPTFIPPDCRTPKFSKKLYIPVDKYPGFNFVGLILGPRGNNARRMEEETGAKIHIRGKDLKYEKVRHRPDPSEKSDLHVLIEADTQKSLDAAVGMVEKLLVPVREEVNELKRAQLKELAKLNGTLKDEISHGGRDELGHIQHMCPGRNSTLKVDALCQVCSGDHPSTCCPLTASDLGNKMGSQFHGVFSSIGNGGAVFGVPPIPSSSKHMSGHPELFGSLCFSGSNSNTGIASTAAPESKLYKEIDDSNLYVCPGRYSTLKVDALCQVCSGDHPSMSCPLTASDSGNKMGSQFHGVFSSIGNGSAVFGVPPLPSSSKHVSGHPELFGSFCFSGSSSNTSIASTAAPESTLYKEIDDSNLYVCHLPPALDDGQLIKLFSPFGKITSATVIKDGKAGLSKGFGFVKYADPANAAKAVEHMNEHKIDGKVLAVRVAGRPLAIPCSLEFARTTSINLLPPYKRPQSVRQDNPDQPSWPGPPGSMLSEPCASSKNDASGSPPFGSGETDRRQLSSHYGSKYSIISSPCTLAPFPSYLTHSSDYPLCSDSIKRQLSSSFGSSHKNPISTTSMLSQIPGNLSGLPSYLGHSDLFTRHSPLSHRSSYDIPVSSSSALVNFPDNLRSSPRYLAQTDSSNGQLPSYWSSY